MKKYIFNSLIAATILFAAACKPEIESAAGTTAGQANFSKYIAVGNSLTSGYADNGLYLEGQKVAFPNLIADKMKTVGGGSFTSPFFTDAQASGSGYLQLTALVNGVPTITPVAGTAYLPTGKLAKYTGAEIQNLGIPGMRLDLAFDPTFTFSAANVYFDRLLPDAQVGKTNYSQFIQGKNHTFFSLWLGNNDVLGYATNGGVTTDATNVLTDKATFSFLYSNMLNILTAGGQKGIVATIPDVTAIPFFNTVTIPAILTGAKLPLTTSIYIQTATGPRVATAADLFTLSFQTAAPLLLGKPNAAGAPYGFHPANPVESKWVLDKDEVIKVKDYVLSYNSTIKSLANTKGLAVADAYTFLNQVKAGVVLNGIAIDARFIQGGAFSLDGVHLTPRGNAAMANLFIDAINNKYGSTIPVVDISQYRGTKFPN
ncbi:SGNH/GDSL hydrolase family protein [Pedobacter punctiformis]|uniref:SGNH/GDSL hydrolase family protein n=1 Tax=Pedobacter punctiformis TaxID=3004097 RepID=A0ABT4L9F2_9SPHI|nr:SGNH/GDSL hydrolase family protein [Pedobacter sp. HCMS5-2]MCZ4244552.1 SGNH/GDSL hydrolase family protein [Pedobacter sp. HCMS5-2]